MGVSPVLLGEEVFLWKKKLWLLEVGGVGTGVQTSHLWHSLIWVPTLICWLPPLHFFDCKILHNVAELFSHFFCFLSPWKSHFPAPPFPSPLYFLPPFLSGFCPQSTLVFNWLSTGFKLMPVASAIQKMCMMWYIWTPVVHGRYQGLK